jgi:hypothetical protein
LTTPFTRWVLGSFGAPLAGVLVIFLSRDSVPGGGAAVATSLGAIALVAALSSASSTSALKGPSRARTVVALVLGGTLAGGAGYGLAWVSSDALVGFEIPLGIVLGAWWEVAFSPPWLPPHENEVDCAQAERKFLKNTGLARLCHDTRIHTLRARAFAQRWSAHFVLCGVNTALAQSVFLSDGLDAQSLVLGIAIAICAGEALPIGLDLVAYDNPED